MEKMEKIDINNTVVLIEKPQMNHSTSEVKIKLTSLSISNEDVKSNEFNEKIDENGKNKFLCEKEWKTKFVAYFKRIKLPNSLAKGVWKSEERVLKTVFIPCVYE